MKRYAGFEALIEAAESGGREMSVEEITLAKSFYVAGLNDFAAAVIDTQRSISQEAIEGWTLLVQSDSRLQTKL